MTATSDYDQAAWLLRRLRADWDAMEMAVSLIADGPGDADTALRVRRYLEGSLGVASGYRVSGAAYTVAAHTLAAEGQTEAVTALRAIAATEAELIQGEERWANRYADRPVTPGDLKAGAMIGTRHVEPSGGWRSGIDGAMYTLADLVPRPGAAALAVVISNSVPMFEVVSGFESQAERAEWLADRSFTRPGSPLDSTVTGPECRAVREERVLAWLLHQTHGEPEPWPELPADMFTTDARSEILLAWRDLAARTDRRDDWLVEAALNSRLLRAPGWAQASTGPSGANMTGYLWRLTNTVVTREAAKSAVEWLAVQDKLTGPPAAPGDQPLLPRQAASPECFELPPPEPSRPAPSPPEHEPRPGM